MGRPAGISANWGQAQLPTQGTSPCLSGLATEALVLRAWGPALRWGMQILTDQELGAGI